jgi:D-3-phosphoglycerate dehydrogenase / 2-oxoglutarate reductase
MKKVLIPTRLDAVAATLLRAHGNYTVVQDDTTPLPMLAKAHPDTYALIVRSEPVTAAGIDALPALRVVIRAGAGYNTIDTRHARTRRIDVMNTPGANSNAVAEEVIAMILADARHVIPADASARSGAWEKKAFMGNELAGKTVGIVGLGNIGQLLARRLSGFEVKVIGYDPFMSVERAESLGVRMTGDLAFLFAEADYISLHVPENDSTRGLVGRTLLEAVKPGATIINCARAGIVDEEALRAVKAARPLRFLNDVYPKDAPGPKSVADLADIMLPHLGANTREANANAARRAAEQLIDFDDKGVTSFIVNRDIPEGLDEAYCELANTLARMTRYITRRSRTPKRLETSFYGDLAPYADWLLTPVVTGICDDFDRALDHVAARQFLKDMGVTYVNRAVDAEKGYGNSITIDLTSTSDAVTERRVSVRGTIAEGIQMISRINEFDRLYFEPTGYIAIFLYDDRTGVIGAIGSEIAQAGVNIEDMRNPHDSATNRSLAILKVNAAIPDDVIEAIGTKIGAIAAFFMRL